MDNGDETLTLVASPKAKKLIKTQIHYYQPQRQRKVGLERIPIVTNPKAKNGEETQT